MRVALVGLGSAGFSMHLPALAGLAGVEVAGVCDAEPARRDRASKAFRVPTYADFDTRLAASRPGVVINGTPPDTHADFCVRAIAAGAHVLCEKPFVPTVAEADRVLQAANAAMRQVAVHHQFREMPICRALLDEVSRDGVDALRFVQVWQMMDMAPWNETGWRGTMVERTLFEAGVHLLDLVMALFEETPISVQASTSAAGQPGETADAIVLATLEFSRGRLAHITQDRMCKGPMQYFEVRADMSEASLRASFGGRGRLSAGLHRGSKPHLRFEFGLSGLAWKERGPRRTVLARNPKAPMVEASRLVITKTLEAFRLGTEPPTSGLRARNILAVVAACYQSAAAGQRIAVA